MFKKSILLLLWMTLVTGIVYPLLITVIAQFVIPFEANGSFIIWKDRPVGSLLIGQKFHANKYFWGRPSAVNYDPHESKGSNLGPISLKLKKQIVQRKEDLFKANEIRETAIPSDLLYASGSGLDPHITVEAAIFQLERVLNARRWNEESRLKLKSKIKTMSKKAKFNSLGMAYINVLELNLALDELQTENESR